MTMNFANGVQFWSIKDNTPANGDRLTDAAAEAAATLAGTIAALGLKITEA